MSQNGTGVTRIIACRVFKPALAHLGLARRYRNVRVTYLPSNLHMRPRKLEVYLTRQIAVAQEKGERVICLYGDCFPGIEEICRQRGTGKVPGFHCYDILLGSEQFGQLIEETAGTYFLERDLVLNFEEYCAGPLELHDEEMRRCCFEHYQRVIYVRQPSDPDLVPQASELAAFLHLSLEIRDADYSHLESKLMELMQA
jgi:hypothetical protein